MFLSFLIRIFYFRKKSVSLYSQNDNTKDMTLTQTQTLATSLMAKHKLSNWSFQFDNAKMRLGCCKFRNRVISFSQHYAITLSDAEIQDTILHEIAHALVGSGHGHDEVWKRKCREIGCRDQRCYTGEVKIEAKYTAVCPKCGHVHSKHRKSSRKSSCGACGNGRFNPETVLTFVQNW